MRRSLRLPFGLRAAATALATLLMAGALVTPSAADLQSQIQAGQSASAALRGAVAGDAAQIATTAGGLRLARSRLRDLEHDLEAREAALHAARGRLLAARNHLVDLENRLRLASESLSANLVAQYEGGEPNLMTVILNSRGFDTLLEQLSFLRRIGNQDAAIVGVTRIARAAVKHQTIVLGALEARDRALTEQVAQQRGQAAAWAAALVSREHAEERTRDADAAKLSALTTRLGHLEARAAAQGAAVTPAGAGGVATNPGGMVQPPPGAPAAVAQVIAAGNAIATLPYLYGGGHASFQANAYDCSGSVSYALAAAGLVSAPLTSGEFESWGEPGPGRWITVYANAGHAWMEVAGWRFDTVAQAEGGTRWAQGGGEFDGFVERHPAGL